MVNLWCNIASSIVYGAFYAVQIVSRLYNCIIVYLSQK